MQVLLSQLSHSFSDPQLRFPLAISLGAIGGSLSRYYLSLWFAQHFGSSFPYGTLAINLSGCLVMGWFMTLAMERAEIPPEARLLLGVGFLGSYTTFSTYELDSFSLWQQHRFNISLLYWLGSALLGAVAMEIGILLARLWR
ncbi:fluoride efflux transporter CrcB [Thermostichus vulcanus]|uniref:Fluoride-specific ion channel FluC n=1 Tax=Thermostichus vulcanus str. 'Rupite' TaxID=2813851 RepID=A0ABT0CFR5_THEVL|nr:fluoride efflux transporter CrcB [Thermostichus vulcanus]MCJ2544623.1 fluoride efflux transporter CrcB [Thermostichus vulcanus str. 'Rupite']